MNIHTLSEHKSYWYLTKKDFTNAFDTDRTILVAKDYRKMKLMVEEDYNSFLLIKGSVLRPIQLKIVNKEKSDESFPNIDDSDEFLMLRNDDRPNVLDNQNMFEHRVPKKTEELLLYRRSMKSKKLLDHNKEELEALSKNVLTRNKYEGKSKFSIVYDKQLVLPKDYSNPDFVSINSPVDIDYEDNYSIEPPSVHDLFDFDIEPLKLPQEEDEQMIEEYIIESLDDENFKILQ